MYRGRGGGEGALFSRLQRLEEYYQQAIDRQHQRELNAAMGVGGWEEEEDEEEERQSREALWSWLYLSVASPPAVRVQALSLMQRYQAAMHDYFGVDQTRSTRALAVFTTVYYRLLKLYEDHDPCDDYHQHTHTLTRHSHPQTEVVYFAWLVKAMVFFGHFQPEFVSMLTKDDCRVLDDIWRLSPALLEERQSVCDAYVYLLDKCVRGCERGRESY